MESSSVGMEELTLESVKAEIYSRNNPTLTPVDIELHAEVVYRILELKKKHNAVILGHNYMEPLVFGLSEQGEQGDSLALSMSAAQADSDFIISGESYLFSFVIFIVFSISFIFRAILLLKLS